MLIGKDPELEKNSMSQKNNGFSSHVIMSLCKPNKQLNFAILGYAEISYLSKVAILNQRFVIFECISKVT